MKSFRIVVPASSANIGPGFDSAGLALDRYLTVHVEPGGKWDIHHLSPSLPQPEDYRDHLIYRAAQSTAERHAKNLPACTLRVESDIPWDRGLGSSATAIVAGVEIANHLCDLELTNEQKLNHAVELEGHPDNVAPALLGGTVFCASISDKDLAYTRFEADDLDFVAFIPDKGLATTEARQIVPGTFSKDHATRASAISNVMIGALMSKDYYLAGKMMEEDLFHEPYRKSAIPDYSLIRQQSAQAGAYGTVISGSGPTMIAVAPKGSGEYIQNHMQGVLPDYKMACLQMDTNGLRKYVD